MTNWEKESLGVGLSSNTCYFPTIDLYAKHVSDNTSSVFIFRQTGQVASEGGEALVDK